MSTTDYWDETDPAKPTGLKDPNARLPVYVSWAEWMVQEDAEYDSHEVYIDGVDYSAVTEGLQIESTSFSNGVLTLWTVGGERGKKYAITTRFIGTVGVEVIRDDRTVYIKMKER